MSIAELVRRVQKLKPPAVAKPLSIYRDDPVGYCEQHKGLYLTPQQKAMLCALAGDKRARILGQSANEVGKSFFAACAASWFYDTRRPSMTVITAPSLAQVTDILFRELRKLRPNDPGFSPRANRLQDADDHMVIGYTANDENSFHGRHEAEVLVLVDEAEGLPSPFWNATESFADRWVCLYNPISAGSQASVEERSSRWNRFQLSALDHPNVEAEILGKPLPVPGAVTVAKILDRLNKWGRELHEHEEPEPGDVDFLGKRYRLTGIGEARILGRRPSKSVNTLLDTNLWDAACRGERFNGQVQPHWRFQLGCDVARFGDDRTVIWVRQGPVVLHHESRSGLSVPQVAQLVRQLVDRYAGPGESPRVPCVIDDTGVGGGVVDLAMGYNFLGVNASALAVNTDEYPNIRSEVHFDFVDILTEGLVDLSLIDKLTTDDTRFQLASVTYKLDTRGRRVVDPKHVVKKAIGASPDDADGLLLCFYVPQTIREVH